MSAETFTNPFYEHSTKKYPYEPAARGTVYGHQARYEGDKKMISEGWIVAWSYIDEGGHYVVYRRKRA